MKLSDLMVDYINAAFTGIWIQTHEPDEAEREIVAMCQANHWRTLVWDVAGGLRVPGGPAAADTAAGEPLAAVKALSTLADDKGTTLLVLHNFHRFLNSPDVIQTVFAQLVAGKRLRTFLIVLAPVVQLPIELEKLFVVLEHALPDRNQLLAIAQELTADQPGDLPQGNELERILSAAAGLTRYEAEASLALSLARHNAIRPETIWELKGQALKKNNLLSLHRGAEAFDTLGGLANLKAFSRRALRSGQKVKPRGLLLLGVSGTGKSCFAKALGKETGRPTLILDIGALLGGLVGQTEANVRQALRIADAMAPCILFVDEIEKALSGVGGVGDSGVSTRLFGTMLTWLSDHTTDVFFIATANDISRLPAEFTRAERFDGVFFIDLPARNEKDMIWKQYRDAFAIPQSETQPDDSQWTGAEIKSCCRLAALLDVPLTQAALNVVPVAVTAAESIDNLRTWASGRCLSANESGIFQRDGKAASRASRKITRDPSNN